MASKLIASTGKVSELRVIQLHSRHGPPEDQIDVEVVAKLDTVPDRGLGFQLRDDNSRPVRQGMLDLLRDAFTTGRRLIQEQQLRASNVRRTCAVRR